MTPAEDARLQELMRLLFDAEATIEALLAGQIDAVVDSKSQTPVLLSKAQEALRESEERYRRIVETTNEGIWTTDLEDTVTFVNRPLADMLGYDPDEILGRSLHEFLPAAAHSDAEHRIERSRRGVSEEAECGFVRKDGSELWVLLKTTAIRDADGNCIGRLAMMTDRTRTRHDEQALRQSESQYRQIVEATTDGILKIDGAAKIVFVNQRFAQMLGYQASEIVGRSVFDLMSAEAKVRAMTAMQPGGAAADSLDTTFRHRDGTDIFVNIAGSHLVDSEELHAGYLGVVRDVTERNKLQSQLMVSDRMASVGTLAAGVAHEINNPLAAVIANLDCIVESLGKAGAGEPCTMDLAWFREEIRSPLDDAREAAQRVRMIVRDLKMFSRSPSEEPRGSVDVKTIMESSLRMAWNEVRHRARLVKHYGVVPGVAANEARLGQVFLNLVVNAAQSIAEGRAEHNEIRIETRHADDRVIIEVRDTGGGVAPEILGRIFDAFFTTKDVGSGTGLGLAICQRIVTDMAGELTVESEVGRGTTFRVSLPVAREDVRPVPAPAPPPPVAGRRGRIMVVDDEVLVGNSIRRILSTAHDVVSLSSAKEALAICLGGARFDLILCDLMMPDMTGMDLHRELSHQVPACATKMIFMTGGAFTAEARRFLEETSKEHVEKPFDPAGLRVLVQRYLREASDALTEG